jgi:hypothetical protein
VKDEATKAASPQAAEVEALKKDLEAKNKEVIDLKVGISTSAAMHTARRSEERLTQLK